MHTPDPLAELFRNPWLRHPDDWIEDVDVRLHDAQPIFRIIDAFAFAEYWITGRLRVSRADQFDDANEGVEQMLVQLAMSRPGSCMIMNWSDQDSARASHARRRSSVFASSWTTAPESVAMWALYSPDRLGVCLESTVGALRGAAIAFAKPRSLPSLDKVHIGRSVTLCTRTQISAVDYRPLTTLRLRAEKLARAYDRLYARYQRNGRRRPFVTEMTRSQMIRYHARSATLRFAPFSLKDTSFEHEAEVRVLFQFGTETVTARELECLSYTGGDDAERSAIRETLGSWGSASADVLPTHEWLPLPTSAIRSVALDPRMPEHRAAFWADWCCTRAVPTRVSNTFGYVLDALSVFPTRSFP